MLRSVADNWWYVCDRRPHHRCSFTACPVPFRIELLCPHDEPMKCSGTYIVTQADVDSGKRSNTAHVTSTSPDGKDIDNSQEKTVLLLGSAAVSIGEALCLLIVC